MSIAQSTHGFSVGDVVRHNGTIYVKAKADSAANAEVVGIVTAVADANNFTLVTVGQVTGLSGLTAGVVYFLSDATAGLLTATEPTTAAHVSKPLLVAVSTTEGYFFNFRGEVIPSSSGSTAWVPQVDQSSGEQSGASTSWAALGTPVESTVPDDGDYLIRVSCRIYIGTTARVFIGPSINGADPGWYHETAPGEGESACVEYAASGLTAGDTISFRYKVSGNTAYISFITIVLERLA